MSSDLKVTNIKHESSSSNNLVLGSDGTTTTTLSSSANIKSAINASGSAPIYACRAWVNFNGTGTVAIRDSGNVSSITDNGGNGDFTVNFTTAMPDANFSAHASGVNNHTGNYGDTLTIPYNQTPNANNVRLLSSVSTSNLTQDLLTITVTVFR